MTSKNTDSPSVLLGMPNMNGTASIRLPCNKRKNTIYLHIHISFNRKWHGFNKHEWKPLSKQHMQLHPARSPENRSTKRNTSGSEALFGGLLLSTSSFTSLHVTSDLPVFFFMLMMEVSTFRATCSSPSNRATCWIEFPAAFLGHGPGYHGPAYPLPDGCCESFVLSFLKRCISNLIAFSFKTCWTTLLQKTSVLHDVASFRHACAKTKFIS